MPHQIPTNLTPRLIQAAYTWNNLVAGDWVLVQHKKGIQFQAQVAQVERLPNCFMMHFEVTELYYEDGGVMTYGRIGRYLGDDKVVNQSGPNHQKHVVRLKKSPEIIQVVKLDVPPANPIPASQQPTPRAQRGRPVRTPSYHQETEWEMNARLKRETEEKLRANAEKRKAYMASRTIISSARDELTEALNLLELDRTITEAEFKLAQRRIMRAWHPDREAAVRLDGGDPTTFRTQSKRVVDALSLVRERLFNAFKMQN